MRITRKRKPRLIPRSETLNLPDKTYISTPAGDGYIVDRNAKGYVINVDKRLDTGRDINFNEVLKVWDDETGHWFNVI